MDTLRKRQDQEWRQDLAEMNRPWLPWETMKIITGYFMGISWNMVINYMAFPTVSRSINWMVNKWLMDG
jgi:hypothetical protein